MFSCTKLKLKLEKDVETNFDVVTCVISLVYLFISAYLALYLYSNLKEQRRSKVRLGEIFTLKVENYCDLTFQFNFCRIFK